VPVSFTGHLLRPLSDISAFTIYPNKKYLTYINMAERIRDKGIKVIEGWVLKQNIGMLQLIKALGVDISTSPDDPKLMHVTQRL
jgi:hypothetical protein